MSVEARGLNESDMVNAASATFLGWHGKNVRASPVLQRRRYSRRAEPLGPAEIDEGCPFIANNCILPDDILCLIFEEVYTPDVEGIAFATRISHVSRRFRSVAFRTPRLWSTVSNRQSPDELGTFLQRSGSRKLQVLVVLDAQCSSTQRRLEIEWLVSSLMPYFGDKWTLDDNSIKYITDPTRPQSLDDMIVALSFRILFDIEVVSKAARKITSCLLETKVQEDYHEGP